MNGSRCMRLTTNASPSAAKGVAVGIDLGTTNSVIAIFDGTSPTAVPVSPGANMLPSVVAFSEGDEVSVGGPAKRQAISSPHNTFASVKRLIGMKFDSAREQAKMVPYKVGGDEDGNVQLLCDCVEGGVLYPEEVSAYVVAELLSAAESFAGSPFRKAVISVPAYFDDDQREATIQAGRLAGLDTVKLIREPVAAALAYGIKAAEDEVILVLDLGGGTFDVSILEVGGGTIEVLSTGGDAKLGGDDFDNLIVDWLASTYLTDIDWKQPSILTNLKTMAEAAKVKLSEAPRVALRLPVGGGGAGTEAVLTRQQLEKLSAPLFKRMGKAVDEACWQAGMDLGTVIEEHAASQSKGKRRGKKEVSQGVDIRPKRRAPISQVLLVGGATRMPAFQRFVKNMTGLQPKGFTVDPDEAVALGAAIQAGIYEGSVSGLMVMDIWQASLLRALATKRLKDDKEAAQELLGEEVPDESAFGDDDFNEDLQDET
ncbi:Chaperone protein dnaK [Coccomyxa sp. Obi]|nr:Chaperone protein dnaK [Coccomyxa sp. Obi]